MPGRRLARKKHWRESPTRAKAYAIMKARSVPVAGSLDRSAAFLTDLGFTIRYAPGATGFLKGIAIERGDLVLAAQDHDLAGELLHEAGHLAVLPSLFRPRADGDLTDIQIEMGRWLEERPFALAGAAEDPVGRAILQCGEAEAVAWSYAAANAIGIDTRIPFYRGFEGEGLDLHDQIAAGYHFGIHGLAAAGMTDLPRSRRDTPFPWMKSWLQI